MDDHDRLIGENLQRLRDDMSQTELARLMREAGHKWTQPTVVSIEKGERPLRLSEAIDLAGIVGFDVYDLIKYPATLSFFNQFARVERLYGDLIESAKTFEAGVSLLLSIADEYTAETGKSLDDDLGELLIRRGSKPSQMRNALRVLINEAQMDHAISEIRVTVGSDDGVDQAEG